MLTDEGRNSGRRRKKKREKWRGKERRMNEADG